MQKRLYLVLVLAASVPAYGQYKLVDGKVVPKNSPDWTNLGEQIEVTGFSGQALICKAFTDQDVVVGSSVIPGSRGPRPQTLPTYQRKRNYGDTFVLTNFPAAGRFRRGDVIRGPIAAMRISSQLLHSGSDSTRRAISRGLDLYDYGVDYSPPQRQLTPEEAAAAKAQSAKESTRAETVKLKFDQEQADKGKDLYQYRMGLRYLNADGVTNDVFKAREYLSKAADQGNEDAATVLRKLPSR